MGRSDLARDAIAARPFGSGIWGGFRQRRHIGRIVLERRSHVSLFLVTLDAQSSRANLSQSRIWDSTTGQCLKTLVHEDNAPVTSVRFSPNGKYVLATTLDSAVRLWSYVEGRCVKTYQGHKNQRYSVNACFGTYEAQGREERAAGEGGQQIWAFVACGDEEGRTVIWDVSSKDVLQILPSHEGAVLGVDASPSSDAIATCGLDGTIKVWWRGRKQTSNGETLSS